jgi:antitoxin VapB
MNAHSKIQRTAALFKSNRSQAVRIPKDMEFPEGVKRVVVSKDGDKIVISPVKHSWDDFFDRPPCPDFPERDQPPVQERDWSL